MPHTRESLIAFRDRVAQAFLDRQIRCPVHLNSDEQAEPLIEIFRGFRPGVDWLCSGWRSMWAALLAGIADDELFDMIVAGRSMFIQSRSHRVFCSSIVGGILPIAAGVAAEIKERALDSRVYCLIGDMTATVGLFHEFTEYCSRRDLPVRVIIEDNEMSTDTPTVDAWGGSTRSVEVIRYRYQRTVPHVGCGRFVQFQ